jgi:hypothetical protein
MMLVRHIRFRVLTLHLVVPIVLWLLVIIVAVIVGIDVLVIVPGAFVEKGSAAHDRSRLRLVPAICLLGQ